jgi:hypothetical protein
MDHRAGFGVFFLGGGLLGIVSGFELVLRKRRLVRRALPVRVRVVEVRVSGGGDDPETYTAVVEYTVAGETLRSKLEPPTTDGKRYRRRKSLDAYYDPLAPWRVAARPRDWPGGMAGVILGAVSALIGAGLLWAWSADGRPE